MKKDLNVKDVVISFQKVCCVVGVTMPFSIFVQVQLVKRFL